MPCPTGFPRKLPLTLLAAGAGPKGARMTFLCVALSSFNPKVIKAVMALTRSSSSSIAVDRQLQAGPVLAELEARGHLFLEHGIFLPQGANHLAFPPPADCAQCHCGHFEDGIPQVGTSEPNGRAQRGRGGWEIPDGWEEG